MSFITTDDYPIDPSTMESLTFETNFLPSKVAITNSTKDITTLHEYNNLYIIRPKALNKLSSGKKIQPQTVSDFKTLVKDINEIENFEGEHDPHLELINQPLEPIPNYFKENTYQDKLNEVLTPKSVKKITSRLQYEVRLQGRQSREGRGEGKYTGDRNVSRNKPQLGFVLYHITNHLIYFPKMKETLPLYIVAFFIKKYPYGEERWFPADEQMLFYSESEVNSYLSPKQMSNKDWIKVSKNLIRDTVKGVVSYLESLKVSYRVKGKLDLDKFTDKVQDKINNNIKDIVENSMFGFLSQTARRGRRMQVKKNLLKSASEIKNTGNTIMRTEFGPLKEFKDLNKDEIEDFVHEFKNNYGKEYDFENTKYNLKYKFEPLDLDSININMKQVGNQTIENLKNKVRNLDGDVFQYFSIVSEVGTQREMGMGILVFCYFFKDDKLDKIEGVVVSFARHKSKPVINVGKKEISTVYPFDDMGVFMYEIITGPKFDLLFRTDFDGVKYKDYPNTPVRRAQGLLTIAVKEAEAEGKLLFNNLKFNTLRNEVIGSLVGRNRHNAMYYYLYPDSDYYGGTEQGQICIGKIDLVYKSIKTKNWTNFSTKSDLEDYPTLQSFKENFKVGVTATTTGTCVHGHQLPKGDVTWAFAGLFLLGTHIDYDKESTPFNPGVPDSGPKYQNIKDNTNKLGLLEGVEYDMMARQGSEGGVGGIDTLRLPERLTTHLTLVRKYGQEFLNWTDSLVKKVLESGEVKIGGKELDAGQSTSKGQSFNANRGHSAYAHIPEKREQEEPEDLRMYKRAIGFAERLIPLFYNIMDREPYDNELQPFSDILDTSNTYDEIIQRTRQFDMMLDDRPDDDEELYFG